ncbi:uncharacterized protein (DUF608 family) [Brachybacterium sacelli]|uniref:Uncharacterized protein (DUF608 family) n=1 Tax=Brachybacterium sacelli TaxID=173364 RepID=A0ABS4WWC5_9MICO|nr:uncharacterized protein (DUF608 family) [Brachybacterium sacelli]
MEEDPVSAVLEAEFRPPFDGASGFAPGRGAGLPRLDNARMSGEYPLATVEFTDQNLPVTVELTAFTPLVPLDADDSGIPAAVLRYRVHNPQPATVDVTIAGSMCNPAGISGRTAADAPTFEGTPTNRYRDDGVVRGIEFSTDLPPSSPLFASAALVTTDASVTATECWLVGARPDGFHLFWEDFASDGLLGPHGGHPEDPGAFDDKVRVGSLGIVHTLAPGQSQEFEFLLAWHTPNRRRAWQGGALPNTHIDETVPNHYAVRYEDAWEVSRDLAVRLPQLEGSTRAFRDALFSSTLPPEVIDAVSSALVALRSTTCFVLDDGSPTGQFAAWEGGLDHVGSCEGTCTHVWNYAQTVAHLFPTLEAGARRNEILRETAPDGRMRFRTNAVFDGQPWDHRPAVDGQLGTIVRVYREWTISGDDTFLEELWPSVRLALDYALTHWDSDGDMVLDNEQHNTYDIEFFGPNSLANSMLLAAVRAGEEMALHQGEEATASRYRETFDLASERIDDLLYNGEYYDQRLDDVDAHRYQYGSGCLADQLLGQTLAHLTGLGHLLPAEHVRSAIAAVHRNNFFPDLRSHETVQRTYAMYGEAGLVLCTWPRGGRPRLPFIYCDEVWTGIEYQVATHLVYEGFVREGLEVVRAVRERHNGVRRNPWNETESGHHYARSMASWGVLLALLDHRWDGRSRTLGLAPRLEALDGDRFFGIITTGTGWGVLDAGQDAPLLLCHGGRIRVDSIEFVHPVRGIFRAVGINIMAGDSIALDRQGSVRSVPALDAKSRKER